MAKVMFQNPPSIAEMKKQLQDVGIQLSSSQEEFLIEHATHRGLTVDPDRVHCRTCNKRDGQ